MTKKSVMLKKLSLIVFVTVVLAGCGQNRKEKFNPVPFPETTLPGMLTDAQDRADWLAQNYWNRMTDSSREFPSDSLLVSGVRKSEIEQRFANWISVLDMVHPSVAEKAALSLCEKALECEKVNPSSNILETFTEMMEKYLYDPNSPYRNEDYYGAYIGRLAKWEGLTPEIRGKYEREASRCALNKVGTKAADFRFADRRGNVRSLYDIKAPLTLLFFSNPGCEACMSIINVLKSEPRILDMIKRGQLAVLNIYIDEDIAAWRSYMSIYPDEWYNGFDPDMVIRTENLYDVRAIPSLYLLDEEKTVIMKDAPENRVFQYLIK